MSKNLFCYVEEKDIDENMKANPELNENCLNCAFLSFCTTDLSTGTVEVEEKVKVVKENKVKEVKEVKKAKDVKVKEVKPKKSNKRKKPTLDDLADLDDIF